MLYACFCDATMFILLTYWMLKVTPLIKKKKEVQHHDIVNCKEVDFNMNKYGQLYWYGR